jgi:hypothetical protein
MHRLAPVRVFGGWLFLGVALALASAQNRPTAGPSPPPPPPSGEVVALPADGRAGGALVGLRAPEHAAFTDGFTLFRPRVSADNGLGPIFGLKMCW